VWQFSCRRGPSELARAGDVLELQLPDGGVEPTQRSARRRSSSTSASSRIADHVLMSDPDARASSTAARSFSARSRSLTAPPSLLPLTRAVRVATARAAFCGTETDLRCRWLRRGQTEIGVIRRATAPVALVERGDLGREALERGDDLVRRAGAPKPPVGPAEHSPQPALNAVAHTSAARRGG